MTFTKEQVENAIALSDKKVNHIANDVLGIQGWSSIKGRSLVNNLMAIRDGLNYLEVGVMRGSMFCSALSNNNFDVAYAVDNWSQFDVKKEEFYKSVDLVCATKPKGSIIICDDDAFKVELEMCYDCGFKFHLIDIYFYDGSHDLESQCKALTYYDKVMADTFIYIVDDWNWEEVRNGTEKAIELLKYEELGRWILPSRGNCDTEQYWNGMGVFLFKKTITKKDIQ